LRFRDFMLGTTLGMAPGLVALTALGHQLMATLTQPNVERIAVLALAALGILLAGVLLSRWLRRRHT